MLPTYTVTFKRNLPSTTTISSASGNSSSLSCHSSKSSAKQSDHSTQDDSFLPGASDKGGSNNSPVVFIEENISQSTKTSTESSSKSLENRSSLTEETSSIDSQSSDYVKPLTDKEIAEMLEKVGSVLRRPKLIISLFFLRDWKRFLRKMLLESPI